MKVQHHFEAIENTLLSLTKFGKYDSELSQHFELDANKFAAKCYFDTINGIKTKEKVSLDDININGFLGNLWFVVENHKWSALLFDNLVEHCHSLFVKNLPSFEKESELKASVKLLVAQYIQIQGVKAVGFDALPRLAETVFDNQLIPLIQSLEVEALVLTPREREYLQKRGADVEFTEVLEKARGLVIENNKDSYKEDVALNKSGLYPLPVIKCLISFEPEEKFIQRLGNPILQEFLIEYKDHINRTVLHYAAAKRKTKIVEALCKIEQVKKLIDHGDNYGRTALHVASSEGNLDVMKELLQNKANISAIDGHDRTAIHIAAINNQSEALALLHEQGIDLGSKDNYGRTPLHLAALFDRPEATLKLLELGAKADVLDGHDKTPLYLAIRRDSVKAIEQFWEKGIDLTNPQPQNKNEDTIVHLAAKYNSVKTLEFLYLCQQYDLNAHNKHHSTPLHHATYYGNVEAVSLLLKFGVGVLSKDEDGRIPLYVAMTNNKKVAGLVEKEISIKKVQIAAKLIDYDYSNFFEVTRPWEKDYKFCSSTGMGKGGFNGNGARGNIKDYYNTAANGGYLDEEVGKFIFKVCKYLSSNENTILKPIPSAQQDHVPLITKIATSRDVSSLKKFVEEFPVFATIVEMGDRGVILEKITDNDELVRILHKIWNINEPSSLSCTELEMKINETNIQAHDKPLDKNLSYFESDVNSFLVNQESFILAQKEKGLTEEIIYSLLLNAAIALENLTAVKLIISENRGSILTHTDSAGYSPISRVLHSGNGEILTQIQQYMSSNSSRTASIDKEDFNHIVTILEFPQFDYLDANEIFTQYLQPLYVDTKPLEDFLVTLGEAGY